MGGETTGELNCRSCRFRGASLRQGKAVDARPYAQRAVNIYTKLGLPDLAAAEQTLRECEG